MKYMGSKRAMLGNSLGRVLADTCPIEGTFADLFAGSGAVAWHMAEACQAKVLAVDKQEYARALAGSVITRTQAVHSVKTRWDRWVKEAWDWIGPQCDLPTALSFQSLHWEGRPKSLVGDVRRYCRSMGLPITSAYGGHYFGAIQALAFDALRATVPDDPASRDTYLAALVIAASECAASPGHTAQPFQPTPTASQFLFDAWRRDAFSHTRRAFFSLASRHAQRKGRSEVGDAVDFARLLTPKDVAFLDPPYSGVQYSRFYHVLETVASGNAIRATGVGRYPAYSERPQSEFSLGTKSVQAFETLAQTIAETGARCIVTYPVGSCSNGLSGDALLDIMASHFTIDTKTNASVFSTLGGNGGSRDARQKVDELIVVGTPRG